MPYYAQSFAHFGGNKHFSLATYIPKATQNSNANLAMTDIQIATTYSETNITISTSSKFKECVSDRNTHINECCGC